MGRTPEKGLTSKEIGDKIIKDFKSTGFNGAVHYPPSEIDVDSLTFDDKHINQERRHNVTLEEAKSYIKNAKVSVTRNTLEGTFENYYGDSGAAYVDVNNKIIRTAYGKNEFNKGTERILDTVSKYEKGE